MRIWHLGRVLVTTDLKVVFMDYPCPACGRKMLEGIQGCFADVYCWHCGEASWLGGNIAGWVIEQLELP